LAKQQAEAAAAAAKQQLIDAALALGKIVLDELGITAGFNCFFAGDLGACAETMMNVLPALVGGFAAKIGLKYLIRFNQGIKLVNKVWNLVSKIVDGVKGWIKSSKALKALNATADVADAAATAADVVGAACPTANSFMPGTLVLLAGGAEVPIEDVDIGDSVVATDPVTGLSLAEPVTATIVGDGMKTLVDITIDTDGPAGHAEAHLTATDGHPFWVPADRQWRKAIDLREGDTVRTTTGKRLQITGIHIQHQHQRVHNLTVRTIHTYYVLAGKTPVLVHNTCPDVIALALTSTDEEADGLFEFALDRGATPWMEWDDPGNPWPTINEALSPNRAAALGWFWLVAGLCGGR
jgi:hypothetical protein